MDSRDKFAQMLREGYEALDPEKEQREYIRELLRQKEQQRKRSIKTITAVAAVFLIVVGAVLAVGGCFGSVEADKNDKTKVEKQGESVIISDENADGQEVGSESIIETDWNKVDKLKDKYPEMITFTDVPEGMEFVSVEVKDGYDIAMITYCFAHNNGEIRVFQNCCLKGEQQTQIVENQKGKAVNYNGYEIYIDNKDKEIKATVVFDKVNVDIMGNLEEKDIYNIINKIKASDQKLEER